jgi:SAM-dependent methyltransferase
VESFAGVGNPFWLRRLAPGEKVVDVGSGAGFDSFIAAAQVGPGGQVVGIDMTAEMLAKSRQTATAASLFSVLDREALASIGIDLEAVRARIEAAFGAVAALVSSLPARRMLARPGWSPRRLRGRASGGKSSWLPGRRQ